VKEFESKLRVYAVYDQDGRGKWIEEHHPNLLAGHRNQAK
jgi:hypothetical protein